MTRKIKFSSRAFFRGKDHIDAYCELSNSNKGPKHKHYHNAMFAKSEEYNADGIIWRKMHPWKYVAYTAYLFDWSAQWTNEYNVIFYPDKTIMDYGGGSRHRFNGSKLTVSYQTGTIGGGNYSRYVFWTKDCKLWHAYSTDDWWVDWARPTEKGFYYLIYNANPLGYTKITKGELHYVEVDFEKEEVKLDKLVESYDMDGLRRPFDLVEIKGPSYQDYHSNGILCREYYTNTENFYVISKDGTHHKVSMLNTEFETFINAFYADGTYFMLFRRPYFQTKNGTWYYTYYLYTTKNFKYWSKINLANSSGPTNLTSIYDKVNFYGSIKNGNSYYVYIRVKTNDNTYNTRIYSTKDFINYSLVKTLPDYVDIPLINSDKKYISLVFSSKSLPYDENREHSKNWGGNGLNDVKFDNYERLPQNDCLGFCDSFSGVYTSYYHIYFDNIFFEVNDNTFALSTGNTIGDPIITGYSNMRFGDINEWENENRDKVIKESIDGL